MQQNFVSQVSYCKSNCFSSFTTRSATTLLFTTVEICHHPTLHHRRDLGIYIDSDLSVRTHVSRKLSACLASLRQIRNIRRSVTQPVLQSLVAALTLSRLDYGCSTMAGLPAGQLNRLQSVLNAVVRLVYSARRVTAPP